ncbi:hypothetical protein [Paenibacillus sp. SI8]|uniref:hypothetical protein n=1 Tax=unclassified Paenibacillus TaxID=185978 RepID=UPI003467A0DA
MMKWDATEHARRRVVERFGVKEESSAILWINQRMEGAAYVTNAPDSSGNMRRVFLGRGVVFHASLTDDVIYTVIPAQKRAEWTETLRKVAERELRKFNAKAVAEERSLIEQRNALELEIIDVKCALLSARSAVKRDALQVRFNDMSASLKEIDRLLAESRRSVVRMAESFSVAL